MIKIYTKEYAGLLQDIFASKQHFLRTFGGNLQVVDGITNKDKFLSLKVSDTDVTVQAYDTGANVAFGTGTGNTNRFGTRKEIISVDVDVEYEAPLAIHEGVDNMTVNDNVNQVIAERTALHAEAWVGQVNTLLAAALSENASETLAETEVIAAFAEAREKFVDAKVSKDINWVAYVAPSVYTLLVKNNLTTTAKNSSVNIDTAELEMHNGFIIEELPSEYFQEGENVIFAADNVGVVGVGVEVYRILDSEDFAGVAIQSAAKYGKYIPEKNKAAILKANITTTEVPGA